MPLSHKSCWQRIARTLTLPALTIALTSTAGCRGDGPSQPSLSAVSPMRWFARGESAEGDADAGPKPGPSGDYSVPPLPPSSPVGRAFVPAPAPEPDAFYGVRPTSQESHEEPRPWSQTLRGMFEPEPKLKPIPSDVEPTSHQSAGMSAYMRTNSANEPPVPPPLLVPPVETDRTGPADIATHIEPVPSRRQPGRLPVIAARRFPMLPSVEPSPWPYRSTLREGMASEPRRIATVHSSTTPASFLPLPGDDEAGEPALLR